MLDCTKPNNVLQIGELAAILPVLDLFFIMQLLITSSSAISPTLRKQVKSLSRRQHGTVQYSLQDMAEHPDKAADAMLLTLWDNGLLVAWALWHNNRAMFYVRKTYRRQGICSELIDILLNTVMPPAKKLIVYHKALQGKNTLYKNVHEDSGWKWRLY